MVYRTHTPRWPLSDFIELLWYCKDYDVPHARERVLPSGTVEIVIDLHGDFPAIVVGAHSEYLVIDTASLQEIIGVHFRPGCARPFLPLPANELCNIEVALDDVCGVRSRGLRDRLLEAPTPDAKFAMLECFLMSSGAGRLNRNSVVAFAVGEFMQVPHIRTVADVTSQIGLSPRRFIQVFREEVGLTPKVFCRVRRFQEVLRRVQNRRRVSWADLAVECGYFDQAHFVRDFQAFSGINPTGYLASGRDWINHVPVGD